MRRAGFQIISALVLVTLSACAGQIRNHGYMPAPDRVADILVGVDTRASVAEQLGLPTTEGLIEQDAYFYVRSRLQNKGLRGAEEIERNILVVSFDKNDVVKNPSLSIYARMTQSARAWPRPYRLTASENYG